MFHGFLAIGTLGSVLIVTIEAKSPESAVDDEETYAGASEAKLEDPTENELEKYTKENNNMLVYSPQELYEMPAIKEDEEEQNITPANFFKQNATSNKRSGKLDKKLKREAYVLHFMKKMLKKLDFTSSCSTTAFGSKAIIRDPAEKIPAKVGSLTSFSY